jgi:hypothetical protein
METHCRSALLGAAAGRGFLECNLHFAICTLQFAIMFCVLSMCATRASADEGMWLFNDPPKKILKEKYNFSPDAQWYEHLQKSSVRFNSGGSGSFVSSKGLVMTNHHIGADALQKMSTKDKDYIATGYYARTQKDEIKCVDLELNVLMSIEDVTKRVNDAIPANSPPAEAQKARRAVMNTIEKESLDKTGLRSDVVTLYQGGLYHLYRFKKYTDVRLVFAPEDSIAFFGGDPDNFEYPRYDLDICFFRVYENDKPVKIEHYLKWSPAGAADGEVVFVSGHPGRTDRMNTVAHLNFIRDRMLPYGLGKLFRYEVLLSTFSQRSAENARRAQDELFSVQNSRKAYIGRVAGLQDPAVMKQKLDAETKFRDSVMKDPKIKEICGDVWGEVADSLRVYGESYIQNDLLERGNAFRCDTFHIARGLLRMAEESQKPNADRLREYRESNLDSLKQELFSEAPIYDDLETVKLADSLSMYMELAGSNDSLLQKVLSGKSPQERAAELVAGTKLKDVALRKSLAAGGVKEIEASKDPMIQLARLVDPAARALRKTYEEKVEEAQRQAYARIANARFALYGTDVYPDATFTLRLAFGVVKGYTELGKPIAPWTTIGGTFQHAANHDNKPPFELPKSWTQHKGDLKMDTPMNFVFTADIIGGNSGSPVVNRNNELVGIIFDGNLQSLVWDYVFDDKEGRATAVHSSAIVEALRKVYDAAPLADELGR